MIGKRCMSYVTWGERCGHDWVWTELFWGFCMEGLACNMWSQLNMDGYRCGPTGKQEGEVCEDTSECEGNLECNAFNPPGRNDPKTCVKKRRLGESCGPDFWVMSHGNCDDFDGLECNVPPPPNVADAPYTCGPPPTPPPVPAASQPRLTSTRRETWSALPPASGRSSTGSSGGDSAPRKAALKNLSGVATVLGTSASRERVT